MWKIWVSDSQSFSWQSFFFKLLQKNENSWNEKQMKNAGIYKLVA